ncbi:S41 family peptidase [Mucilaginibacter sp. AW1-3]
MKNNAITFFRTIMLLFAGALMGIWFSNENLGGHRFFLNGNDKLQRVVKLVHDKYVDSVDIDSLEGKTVNQVLQNLDPHSLYLPSQRAQSINERLDGGFYGVGIEYLMLDDTLYISQVLPGGPAARAGIVSGDRVINLNDKKLAGTHLTTDQIDANFRGAKNTELQIGVLHPGSTSVKTLNLKRDHVDLSSLDAAYMVGPNTGYVKISKFAATTDRDFKAALKKLQAQGMQKLVLDLRDNGGGYLSAATAMADEFLPAGKLIMYTRGVHEPRTDYFATDSGLFEKGKLAVLINEYSASASEILAGALQDLDRATIVGRRSFGKGLVQEQFAFGDGSAVNLTIARYYTPSGRSIQKSYKDGADTYHNELAERMRKGELFSEKSNLDDSIFKQPSKYHTANGRKVFSGGGIMPDVFIPADTTGNTELLYSLSNRQHFMAFAIQKMQRDIKQYPTFDAFSKNYQVNDDTFTDFLLYASKTLKQLDSDQIKQSDKKIRLYLKAFAARFKWGDDAYFKILNKDDVTLKAAVAVL